MKKTEVETDETVHESNPYAIQLDVPLQKIAPARKLELKAPFPAGDALRYYGGP